MNELTKVFAYDDNLIRVVGTPDRPLFVAADMCRVLGIKQPANVMRDFTEQQKGMYEIHTLGGPQQTLVVTEAGLYRLIFRSNKAAARKFQDWVFSEVLPSIRKTGGYGLDREEKLWTLANNARTGAVQQMCLLALGIGKAGAEPAKQASANFKQVQPAMVWQDVLDGLQAGNIGKHLLRSREVLWEPAALDLFISPKILNRLRELHPERYLIDYRDLRLSLMLMEEWVSGNHRTRLSATDLGGVAVWKFTTRTVSGVIHAVAKLVCEAAK